MTNWKRISVPVHRRLAGTSTFRPPLDAISDVDGDEDAQRPATTHIFRIGQRLDMIQGTRYFPRGASVCKVIGLVPIESGQIRYRVRGEDETFDRIVVQADLRAIENTP